MSTTPDLIEPLGFAFMQRALLGSLIVALVCAVVGVLVVLRGLAFLGDAVAHAAFPGIVIAFLLKTNLIIGGMVAAVLASVSMGVLSRRGTIREDTAIGVVFAGMFALGIVLFSRIRQFTGDLLGVLLGNVLAITNDQLVVGAITALFIVGVLRLWWRELIFVSFDSVGAAAAGLHVFRYDALLLALIGLTVAVAVQLVGIVLVVAMLVTPAATARLFARDMRSFVAFAIALSVGASVVGLWLSYYANASSGGTIVLVATAEFIVVWLATQFRRA
ncbi:MAG: metal ABC transporter permease [Chloroflexi bacterium]|nr:MAG: metal ABC transporter permease [Chloroflexota bacterium]TMC28095.1 MAG: metal ABC transporter permease [Chloroflexota bacterium]TMC33875.1 MAG: metal ABC transporter permease [Chloroflexota bacterium]TMC51746.1 MAG: metal ABC transporter permease [Chloroflexota bacterium]